MKSLITKLEQAREGNRELDEEIAEIVGRIIPLSKIAHGQLEAQPEWVGGNSSNARFLPFYTTSLDAAFTLVPEGWMVASISEFIRHGEKRSGVMLMLKVDAEREFGEISDPWAATPRTEAATPALALTAASLKARA